MASNEEILAVHSVHEFAIGVPDLEVAHHFYSSFGLEVRVEQAGLGLYTHGHPHRWARVLGGHTRKKLLWVRFGVRAEDMSRFAAKLDALGHTRSAVPSMADQGGLWIESIDGVPIQLVAAEKCSPSAPAPRHFPPASTTTGAANGRAPARSRVAPVRPLHLSHILFFTSDVDASLRFFCDVLGFRLSDRSGSVIAFLHSPHGSDHHLVAFAKSNGPGLHHSSWCVPSIDAVGLGMEQMVRAGYPRGWGVGRHALGSNYFRYVQDPWGSFAEYSFDIDFIAPTASWDPGDHPGEDALHVWGPEVPPDFVSNNEVS